MSWSAQARLASALARRRGSIGSSVAGRTYKSKRGKTYIKGGAVLVGLGSRGSRARLTRAGMATRARPVASQFLVHTRKSYITYTRR